MYNNHACTCTYNAPSLIMMVQHDCTNYIERCIQQNYPLNTGIISSNQETFSLLKYIHRYIQSKAPLLSVYACETPQLHFSLYSVDKSKKLNKVTGLPLHIYTQIASTYMYM